MVCFLINIFFVRNRLKYSVYKYHKSWYSPISPQCDYERSSDVWFVNKQTNILSEWIIDDSYWSNSQWSQPLTAHWRARLSVYNDTKLSCETGIGIVFFWSWKVSVLVQRSSKTSVAQNMQSYWFVEALISSWLSNFHVIFGLSILIFSQ